MSMNHQDVTHIIKISHYTVLRYISCYVLYVLFIIHKKGQGSFTQTNSMHNKQFCWKVSSRPYLDTLEFSVLVGR